MDSISLEAIGLILVAIGLIANAYQLKQSAKIAQAANYNNAIAFQKDTWLAFLLSDKDSDELLKWHLQKRGIQSSTPLEAKKTFFYLMRMDVYEQLLLAHQNGILTKPQIEGWENAVVRDMKDPEFLTMYNKVGNYYASVFKAIKQRAENDLKKNENSG